MAPAAPCIVFTDLDGTLLNGNSYAYAAAQPTIAQLQQQGIPVVPVTSKTRQEVVHLRAELGLTDPFVVENGSAIYLPLATAAFALPKPTPTSEPDPESDRPAVYDQGGYRVLNLGCTYVMARAGMKALALTLGRPLKGFGDLNAAQLQTLTQLSPEEAKAAKAREFSEPFLTPKNIDGPVLAAMAVDLGFQVVVGNRFSHLIGANAGKGRAVQQLVALYQAAHPQQLAPVTLGLGDSPNDLPLLAQVDYPVVVPGANGPHPQLAERGWPVAPTVAPEGWRQGVALALAQAGIALARVEGSGGEA